MTKQNDKELTNATELQEYKPTPHMLVWLDTQIKIASDVIDEISEKSGIDETTWYRWLKQPGFEDWYWTEYDKRVRRWKPTIDSLGLKFAKKGSPQHFEYLAKRVGNIEDKSSTIAAELKDGNKAVRIVVTRGE